MEILSGMIIGGMIGFFMTAIFSAVRNGDENE